MPELSSVPFSMSRRRGSQYGRMRPQYALREDDLAAAEDIISSFVEAEPIQAPLQLRGTRQSQVTACIAAIGFRYKHKKVVQVYNSIQQYLDHVRKEEQPYHHVKNLLSHVQRQKRLAVSDVPNIQTPLMRYQLFVTSMLLRLELAILSKAIALKREGLTRNPLMFEASATDFILNLTANRQSCRDLFKLALEAKYPAQEVEGHLFWARYAALEQSVANISKGSKISPAKEGSEVQQQFPRSGYLRGIGLAHVEHARSICGECPGQTDGFLPEVESTSKMLRDEFFEAVTNEERREVVRAMANEFSGTGHWYYCVNQHPFTIGECGMPMQQAR